MPYLFEAIVSIQKKAEIEESFLRKATRRWPGSCRTEATQQFLSQMKLLSLHAYGHVVARLTPDLRYVCCTVKPVYDADTGKAACVCIKKCVLISEVRLLTRVYSKCNFYHLA